MVNPASLMKLMGAKNKFVSVHPKFAQFFTTLVQQGVQEGDIIEITVTRTDGSQMTGNMRVQQSDLELMEELKGLQ